MTYRAPKGTDDILAPTSRAWLQAERVFFDLAERYGYDLVLTPLFEQTELFARGVGESTEVVEKQMYTFTDKGGRSVTLRPEATASVVRAVIEAGGMVGPFKGVYWGPMFRYERPQAGRRRQFMQGGVEYLGEAAPEADIEVIDFGYRYLRNLNVPEVQVELNSIGDAADRTRYRQELVSFLESRSDRLSPQARERMETNPMRVLDSKEDAEVVADAPAPSDHLGPQAAEHFEAVRRGLDRLGIPHIINPRLVRGLDYYNRTVWEYVPLQYGAAQSSVGGGGRYDGLFELLGGKPTPAVGLAMGVDRIILAMEQTEEEPALDAFVVSARPEHLIEALALATRLRSNGFRVDLDVGGRSVKAQFRAADRRSAKTAIVVGEEYADREVTVRDLTTGKQDTIPVEEIGPWLEHR